MIRGLGDTPSPRLIQKLENRSTFMPKNMPKHYNRDYSHYHRWPDDERLIVRRDYKGDAASAQAIADGLGISFYAVKAQVQKMGISFQDRHYWSRKEDEQLEELMTRHCPGRVAKLMHRSINSVVLRAKRLGISRRDRDGWYTKLDACELLGVDHKWLQLRIDCGALKAKAHNPDVPPQKCGGSVWEIREEDLIDYIRTYPQELIGRNVDIIGLVDILCTLKKVKRQTSHRHRRGPYRKWRKIKFVPYALIFEPRSRKNGRRKGGEKDVSTHIHRNAER